MNINVSKKGSFVALSFWLFVSLALYLSPIREIRVSKQHTRNTTSWEVGIGERRRQRESRRQVPWGLAFTSYCLFSCACPKVSLLERMTIECRRVPLSTIIASAVWRTVLSRGHFTSTFRAVTSPAPCALLLQFLARSAIGVAHDDRAALFAVD